ncbi:MAG: hypothetical protein AAB885_02675, partial [Patescibacteria group bacterium]
EEKDDAWQAVIRELKQATAFYSSRFGGEVKSLIVTPNITTDLLLAIQEHFKFHIKKLGLKFLPELKTDWFPALGAHLRGVMPRSKDGLVSLLSVGTEEQYFSSFISHFISKWRNIALAVLGAALVLFVIFDNILLGTERNLDARIKTTASRVEVEELKVLEERARYFNQLAEQAKILEEQSVSWSPLLLKLNNLSGAKIIFDKLSLSADKVSPEEINYNGIIIGRGDNEIAIIDFKNRLLSEKNIANVNLPLSSIITGADKKAAFTLNFQIKSFGP